MTRAVFLDRDGTLNEKPPEGDYVRAPQELVLLAGAAVAVRQLNDAGWRTVLVSNQRGVARGMLTLDDVAAVNARLGELLAAQGARLDAVYVCPHEKGACDCRKPRPGLLLRAARDDPQLDLAASVTVGDAESDVLAGVAAGTRTVRIAAPGTTSAAGRVAADLAGAVAWILHGALEG